jgi:hypothetical protein
MWFFIIIGLITVAKFISVLNALDREKRCNPTTWMRRQK